MNNVLIACEFSGVVREAFHKLGWNAVSCDLLLTEILGQHYTGDVRDIIYCGWDLLIAHPPCTRLANSGVQWLEKRNLWNEMREGAKFFKFLLDAPIEHKAIENPIPHKYAMEIIGLKYNQIIQPYQFGHPESKATCLWLINLPKLISTNDVKDVMIKLPISQQQRNHYMPPSPDRWKERSRTYQGIADAMAQQWTNYFLSKEKPDANNQEVVNKSIASKAK